MPNLTIALTDQSQHLPPLITELVVTEQLTIDAQATDAITIYQAIDAQGLACPMPLLKVKLALKHTPQGQAVYLLASDKHACHDIAAFAKHANLQLWQAQTVAATHAQYHFILW